jgi:hypothetical protein
LNGGNFAADQKQSVLRIEYDGVGGECRLFVLHIPSLVDVESVRCRIVHHMRWLTGHLLFSFNV